MKDKIKAIFCVLFGHSRIQTTCFGYFYCSRCGYQLGDTIAASYNVQGIVIVGHDDDCERCQKNIKKLTWRDKFMATKP